MTYMAHKDQPMIPPVARRPKMEPFIEDIVGELTFTIIDWEKSSNKYRKNSYEDLVKNGFMNRDFLWLTQFAVDYIDYLMFKKHQEKHEAITHGSAKAIELYLALLIKKSGQLHTELPGVQNYYKARINEYPELTALIREHLSKFEGDILGAKEMQSSNIPPYQQFYGADGQIYYYDNMGQLMRPSPGGTGHQGYREPTLTEKWDQVQRSRAAGQRYQQPQYQPSYHRGHPGYGMPQQQGMPQGYPGTQQSWGPNPGYQSPPPPPPTYGNMELGPHTGSYSGYSQQQTGNMPSNNSLGPMTPHTSPSNNPQAQSGQRHIDIPAPQPMGQQTPISTPRPGTTPKEKQAPAPVSLKPVSKKSPYPNIVKTHAGYECSYFVGDETRESFTAGLPIMFDPSVRKGIYQLDSSKTVIGFKTTNYKEDDVEYGVHETVQFFNKTREEAPTPSKKRTREVLADIQRKLFVKQKLEEIEGTALEGNVSGDEEIELDSPIYVTQTIQGDLGEKEYLSRLFAETDIDVGYQNVINYEHILPRDILLTGACAEIAARFKKVDDWYQIKDILTELLDEGLPLYHWAWFNQTATNFVNDVVRYRLNVDLSMDSFDVDIDDMVSVLHSEHEIRNDFTKHVHELCKTWFYPSELDKDAVLYFPGKDDPNVETDDINTGNTVTFVTLTDVTLLPIESSSIYLPIPDKDKEYSEGGLPSACIVTSDSYPTLFAAIQDRVNNANIRVCQVVFVTRDNMVMYIKKTGSDDAYVISRNP